MIGYWRKILGNVIKLFTLVFKLLFLYLLLLPGTLKNKWILFSLKNSKKEKINMYLV